MKLKELWQNDLVKIGVIVLGIYLIVHFFGKKEQYGHYEHNENIEMEEEPEFDLTLAQPADDTPEGDLSVAKPVVLQTEAENQTINELVGGKQNLKAQDLMPVYDEADEFVAQNPVHKLLKEQNVLVSTHNFGVSTNLQSSKIDNYDLRSAPIIPRGDSSTFMWNFSSYTDSPYSKRRYLEIGG